VENSANLPVYKDISNDVAAPAEEAWTVNTICLRPGDRGWVIASVSVATGDSAAFDNAAIAKVSAPSLTSAFSDAVASTPYKVRYTPGGGLHVDVIDVAYAVQAVFLDGKGLPVGTDYTNDFIPSEQSNQPHLVYTYSFAEPEVLGSATTVLVYTSVSQ
jgi:hypothetical protein